MKKILLICSLWIIFSSTAAFALMSPSLTTSSIAPMLKQTLPAVVNISVRGRVQLRLPFVIPGKTDRNGKISPKFAGVGSGVIVNANKGYILTNYHVVKDAKIIVVTLHDGRRLRGKLLGGDEKSDIALLSIRAKHLEAIPLGDSSKLEVGDFVAAIGNPFGLSQTVTSGVISGLGRSHLGIEGYENFIQTDAPINPGNSGGALLNMQGKLIGINTAIITPRSIGGNIGIGLAIPVNMCKSVMSQIIKYGKVEHSIIGVMVQNITPALATAMQLKSTKGALISDVSPGTPAYQAGLQTKDIIIDLNGKPVRDAFVISTGVGLQRPGSRVTLKILRDHKFTTITVKTMSIKAAKKAMEDAQSKYLLSGLALRNYAALEDNQQITGVEVVHVDDFSVAYSCGLRRGDVILAANSQDITDIDQLREIAKNNSDNLLIKVKHKKGGTVYLVLEK